MIPTRAALAIPAAMLVLSGCGAAAPHTPRATTVSVSLPKADPVLATAELRRPLPVVPVAPTYLVAKVTTGSTSELLEILEREVSNS